jgi:hypothetical protein
MLHLHQKLGCGIFGKLKGARKLRIICLQSIKCYRMDMLEEVMGIEAWTGKRKHQVQYKI